MKQSIDSSAEPVSVKSKCISFCSTYKHRKRGIHEIIDAADALNKFEKVTARRKGEKPRFRFTTKKDLIEKEKKEKKQKKLNKQQIENHRIVHCPHCFKTFDSWKDLLIHQEKVHKKTKCSNDRVKITFKITTKLGNYSINNEAINYNEISNGDEIDIGINNGYKKNKIWRFIDENNIYYPLSTKDPYYATDCDYKLCHSVHSKTMKISPYSYKSDNKEITCNNSSRYISSFREQTGIKRFPYLFQTKNYKLIDNENNRFPTKSCIQCNQQLYVMRVCKIGFGELHYYPSQKIQQVPIYRIALICSNFPCCEFPRARRTWRKTWIKNAYYIGPTPPKAKNDQNKLSSHTIKSKRKRTRKTSNDDNGPSTKRQKKRNLVNIDNVNSDADGSNSPSPNSIFSDSSASARTYGTPLPGIGGLNNNLTFINEISSKITFPKMEFKPFEFSINMDT